MNENVQASYFSWTENDSAGSNDRVIGTTNAAEIDLDDKDAQMMINDWQKRLNNGEHITVRIDN